MILRGTARQIELTRRAKRTARAVDAILGAAIREIVGLRGPEIGGNARRAADRWRRALDEIREAIYARLRAIAMWSDRLARRQVAPLQEAEFDDLVLDPLSEEDALAIVFGRGDWAGRISALTRLADPRQIGNVVAIGVQAGKTPGELFKDLLPLVDGVRASARRIARTESVRVGHESQMATWESMGDAIAGYRVRHSSNPNQRAWHADRDGTEYWKSPGPGQKGLFQMPRPPMEAEDPRERPAGAPIVASNCLCYLEPILR